MLDPGLLDITEIPSQGRRKAHSEVEALPEASESFWRFFEASGAPDYRDLRREGAPPVDLVIVSHAHQDHVSDLEYVSADVPAASSRMTAFISKVLLDAGPAGVGGAPFVLPRAPDERGRLVAGTRGSRLTPMVVPGWGLAGRGF